VVEVFTRDHNSYEILVKWYEDGKTLKSLSNNLSPPYTLGQDTHGYPIGKHDIW
jgi:hypothetical protein